MSSGKKKGKKSRGQTLNLNDFLASTPSTVIPTGARDEYGDLIVTAAALPTAPRSEHVGSYDEEKVPDRPPFTAYVGNLPYNVIDIELEKFFKDSKIINIRLPSDNGSQKGFGYIEVEDRDSLISILKCNGTPFNERMLKIDLATGNLRNSADDKTNFNWRLRDSGNAFDEQGGRENRGGFPQTSDADLDQAWVKKGNFESSQDNDRGFGGNRDRGGGFGRDRDNNRGFGWDREGGNFNRDGDRSNFNRDGDRSNFNRDGDRSNFNRDGDRSNFNRDGDRGNFNKDGDRGNFNRDGDRGNFNRDGDGGSFNRDRRGFEEDNLNWSRTDKPRDNEPVQQIRKPLVLTKRTKPIEEIIVTQLPSLPPKEEVKKPNIKVSSWRNDQKNSFDKQDEISIKNDSNNEDIKVTKKVYMDAPIPAKSAWNK